MDLQQEISVYNQAVETLHKLATVPDKTFLKEKRVWETVYDTYCSKSKLQFKSFAESKLFNELFTKKTGFQTYEFSQGVERILSAYNFIQKINNTAIPLPTKAPESEREKLALAEKMAPFFEACDWSEVKKTVEVFQNYNTYCQAAKTLNEMAKKAKALPEQILPSSEEDANHLEAVKQYTKKRASRRKFFTVLLSIPTCGVLFLVALIIYLLDIVNPDGVTALFILAGIFTPIFIFIPRKLIKHFNEKIENEERWSIQYYGYSYIQDNFLEAVKKLNATSIQKTTKMIACIDTLTTSYNTVSNAFDIRYRKEDLPLYKNLLNKGLAETLKEARDVIAEQKRRRTPDATTKEIADTLLAIQTALQEKRQAERDKARLDQTLRDIKKGADALEELKEIEKEKQKTLEDLKNSLHHY